MRTEFTKAAGKSMVKKMLTAGIVGNGVTMLLLAVCAVGVWRGNLPESAMKDLALGAAVAGAIVSGCWMSGKGRGALHGLLGGCGFLLLAAVAGLYREQLDFFDRDFIRLVICAAAGGGFGGVISTGKRNKKRSARAKKYTLSNH